MVGRFCRHRRTSPLKGVAEIIDRDLLVTAVPYEELTQIDAALSDALPINHQLSRAISIEVEDFTCTVEVGNFPAGPVVPVGPKTESETSYRDYRQSPEYKGIMLQITPTHESPEVIE